MLKYEYSVCVYGEMCTQKKNTILFLFLYSYEIDVHGGDFQILAKIDKGWQRILRRMAKDIEYWMKERGEATVTL